MWLVLWQSLFHLFHSSVSTSTSFVSLSTYFLFSFTLFLHIVLVLPIGCSFSIFICYCVRRRLLSFLFNTCSLSSVYVCSVIPVLL
jgi:hypothetical protein